MTKTISTKTSKKKKENYLGSVAVERLDFFSCLKQLSDQD